MTTTITVTDGVTHTGDCAMTLEAALTACVTEIMSDPEWTIQVVIAAILAQHELNKGIDIRKVKETLREGLDYREIV